MLGAPSGTRLVMRIGIVHHQTTVFIGQDDELVEGGATATRIAHLTATDAAELYVCLVGTAALLRLSVRLWTDAADDDD